MNPLIFAVDSSSKKPFSLAVLGDASVPMVFKYQPRGIPPQRSVDD